MQYISVKCCAVQCTVQCIADSAVYCRAGQYSAVQCSEVKCGSVKSSEVKCGPVKRSEVQCSAGQYSARGSYSSAQLN